LKHEKSGKPFSIQIDPFGTFGKKGEHCSCNLFRIHAFTGKA